jgi:hypothetical protein
MTSPDRHYPEHDADGVEGVISHAADAAVDGYRGMVYAGIAGLALIFAASALGTSVMYLANPEPLVKGERPTRFTIGQLCGIDDCSDYHRTSCAAWSFYILATIMTGIDIMVGVLSHFAPNALARKIPYESKFVLLGFAIVTSIFSGLACILAIVTVSAAFCGWSSSLHYGFTLGASPILMIVVFLCSIGTVTVAKVMAPRSRNERDNLVGREVPQSFDRDTAAMSDGHGDGSSQQ